jgi:hypothetical protein
MIKKLKNNSRTTTIQENSGMVIARYGFKIKFMKSIATILKGTAPALALFAMTQCTTTAGVSAEMKKHSS